MERCSFKDLDDMMERMNEIVVVNFNYEVWEKSTCTCRKALKYYRCSHIIVLATRLPNASTNKAYVDIDDDIFKMMKISRARQAGRSKKTVGALQRQPNELQTNEGEEGAACTSNQVTATPSAKRGRGRPPKVSELVVVQEETVVREEAVIVIPAVLFRKLLLDRQKD